MTRHILPPPAPLQVLPAHPCSALRVTSRAGPSARALAFLILSFLGHFSGFSISVRSRNCLLYALIFPSLSIHDILLAFSVLDSDCLTRQTVPCEGEARISPVHLDPQRLAQGLQEAGTTSESPAQYPQKHKTQTTTETIAGEPWASERAGLRATYRQTVMWAAARLCFVSALLLFRVSNGLAVW